MRKVSTFELIAFVYGMVEAYYEGNKEAVKTEHFPIILYELMDTANGEPWFNDYIGDNFPDLVKKGIRYVEGLFNHFKNSDISILEDTYLAALHQVIPMSKEDDDNV